MSATELDEMRAALITALAWAQSYEQHLTRDHAESPLLPILSERLRKIEAKFFPEPEPVAGVSDGR